MLRASMRGSPFMRTLMVLIAVALTGFGLTRLGASRQPAPPPVLEPLQPSKGPTLESPFFLTLSAPAEKVHLESSGKTLELDGDKQVLSGVLTLEVGHPTIFITVVWSDPSPTPRFAKLVLEPPSHPTLTRIFDASGEISDVWELHLHD